MSSAEPASEQGGPRWARTGCAMRWPPRCSARERRCLDISQVLRHRDLATTQVYAKVDLAALRSVAQPWPEGAER